MCGDENVVETFEDKIVLKKTDVESLRKIEDRRLVQTGNIFFETKKDGLEDSKGGYIPFC